MCDNNITRGDKIVNKDAKIILSGGKQAHIINTTKKYIEKSRNSN